MTFKIFFQLPSSCFQKVIRPKNGQKRHFWPIIFFFQKIISRKRCILRKKQKIRSIGKIFQTCDFCHQKSSTKTRRCFSEAVFFSLKKAYPPVTGTKQKKGISNFVQNFILIMIEIEPKLAGKVLVGNPYFPV